MAQPFPPQTYKAWQHTTTANGIEKDLFLNPSTPFPAPNPNRHLVQIIAASLNPTDWKPAEVPWLRRFLFAKVATPGLDFSGVIIRPATGSSLKPGQLVFGLIARTPFGGGSCAEFALTDPKSTLPVPEGVDPVDAACNGIAAITAYQSIVPYVRKGCKIFINGGSGGTGMWGIQIAKLVGCYVVTTCSPGNVELCRSLGADEVIDYTENDVIEVLKGHDVRFDHVVDNVNTGMEGYFRCHEFTSPAATWVMVGGREGLYYLYQRFKAQFLPAFLGGGKRPYIPFWPATRPEDLVQTAEWLKEGRLKVVYDEKFPFEEVSEAFARLKTGRARGKIVVDVASKTYHRV